METVFIILLTSIEVVIGIALGIFLRKRFVEARKSDFEEQGRKLIEDALNEADQIKKEASMQIKDEAYQLKLDADKEIKERKADIVAEEKKLSQKLDQIERKIDLIDKRELDFLQKEKAFMQQENSLSDRKKEMETIIDQQRNKLEKISGITRDEAKDMLKESIESEARMEAAKNILKIENEMKMKADKKAKNILALAISRYAGDYVAEKTVSVVNLPNEEMKGRIIGREGRNIRAVS